MDGRLLHSGRSNNTLSGIRAQFNRLLNEVEARIPPETPSIHCCWGHEAIEEVPGMIVIRTEWGTAKLADEDGIEP